MFSKTDWENLTLKRCSSSGSGGGVARGGHGTQAPRKEN